MSVENLKEYARRCAEEPELRAKARELGIMDLNAHQELAASLGLDWTMDDMDTFRKEVVPDMTGVEELDDETLQEISGGIITITAAVVVGGVVGLAVVTTTAVGVGLAVGSNSGW